MPYLPSLPDKTQIAVDEIQDVDGYTIKCISHSPTTNGIQFSIVGSSDQAVAAQIAGNDADIAALQASSASSDRSTHTGTQLLATISDAGDMAARDLTETTQTAYDVLTPAEQSDATKFYMIEESAEWYGTQVEYDALTALEKADTTIIRYIEA